MLYNYLTNPTANRKDIRETENRQDLLSQQRPVICPIFRQRKVKSFSKILEVLRDKTIFNFRGYSEQATFVLEGYSPKQKKVVDVKLFKTQESYKKIVESYKRRGLYPLLLPNSVKVPKSFWEKYRRAKNGYERVKLVKEFGLLADGLILQLKTLVIDVDSEFERVYPAWEELKEKLAIFDGYAVVKTKSGRFRAYLFLEPTGIVYTDLITQKRKYKQFFLSAKTKHLKRAQEFVSIILAFFESKGLKADHTFGRLNHPIFPEGIDYDGRTYEIIEFKNGFAGKFYDLYYRMKQIQKEENLWYLGKTYLPGKFWGKKERRAKEKKEPKIIKAPAFVRILEENKLDVLEFWKRAVISLSQKYTFYRYVHVIQPAIGWAKYLNLPKEEVDAFLLSILGEEKEKDIEKAWKYTKELEFKVPERIEWAGKTREEWEKEVRLFLKANNGVAFRQILIKEVFGGQEWLADLIMWGMVKKGIVEWRKYWEKKGRGRKPYVFALNVESEALPKVVGAEDSYIPNWLNSEKNVARKEEEKTQNNNSSPKGEEQRSGLVEVGNLSSELVEKEGRREFLFGTGEKKVLFCGIRREEERSRGSGLVREREREKEKEREREKGRENYLNGVGVIEKFLRLFENCEYQRVASLKAKSELYFVSLVSIWELRRRNRELGKVVGKLLSYLTVRESLSPKGVVVWLTEGVYSELRKYLEVSRV